MDVLLSNNLFQLVVPIKMQNPFYSHGMITVRQPVSGLVLPESQSFLDTDAGGQNIPVVLCDYGDRDMFRFVCHRAPLWQAKWLSAAHPPKKALTRWSGQRVLPHGNAP